MSQQQLHYNNKKKNKTATKINNNNKKIVTAVIRKQFALFTRTRTGERATNDVTTSTNYANPAVDTSAGAALQTTTRTRLHGKYGLFSQWDRTGISHIRTSTSAARCFFVNFYKFISLLFSYFMHNCALDNCCLHNSYYYCSIVLL